MTLTPYTWRDASLRRIDAYWHDLYEEIQIMHINEREMKAAYENVPDTLKPRWSARILNQQAEIKRVIELQAEVEMFLIEHESPGWTSK
jgi:hypothetical protein